VGKPEGALLESMFEQGRAEWPRASLDRAIFEDYVRERASEDGDPSSLRAAELFLACACAHADPHALAAFDECYLVHVPLFLKGMSADERFVDDVRQQVRERLFVAGKIRQYSGRGALPAWLRVVTLRVALNLKEADDRPHDDVEDLLPGAVIDPELAVIQHRYGEEFRLALREALAGLDAEDRSMLRLHYVDGLNIDKIGVVLQVSRATIGRRMIKVRESLFDETRRLLTARLKATPEELDSILRVVRSGLSISLSLLLRESQP